MHPTHARMHISLPILICLIKHPLLFSQTATSQTCGLFSFSFVSPVVDKWTLYVFIGNKIDLAEKREVLRQRAEDFADAQSMLYLETSAKESDNVEKLFLDLACELIREAKQNKLDNSDTAPMPGEGKTISYLSCCNIN